MAGSLAQVVSFWRGKLTIGSPYDSFTEIYDMAPGSTKTQAQTALGLIMTARVPLLAGDMTIKRASLSNSNGERDKAPPIGGAYDPILVGAEVAIENSNLTGDGLDFRFETLTGKFATKCIKGVRDSWIENNTFTITPSASYPIGGPYLAYAAPDAEADLISNFLSIVRDKTALYVWDEDTDMYDNWTFETWVFRMTSRRKIGGRFAFGRGRQRNFS